MINGGGPRKHTIAVLVENKFGVLSRVAGLFSARGYNIESLSVGETLDPSVSRMTLVVRGDEFVIEQVTKQLHKLIDVIKVTDLTDEGHVERELVLIRVNAEPSNRAEAGGARARRGLQRALPPRKDTRCPRRSTTTRTPISACSRGGRSRSSATAARGTPTRSTSRTRGRTSSSGSTRARRAGRRPRRKGSGSRPSTRRRRWPT